MVRSLAVAAAALALLPLAACTSPTSSANDGRIHVVTTVSPITSIASQVIGDRAELRGIIPEGADSHTFEPPPSAAKALARADVVFVNGLKLDDPTKDLAAENLRDGAEIVPLGNRTITPTQYIYDFSFPKSGGKPNPHLWTDPPYAERYAAIIRDTMIRHDRAHAADYRANFDRFAAKVDALDRAMVAATKTVPRPELLTYHDAYAYFARHYGWKVVGAIQVSTFEDPTPREVARLIEQIKAEKVPAIFGSEVFPSPVLAQIGKETGVRYVDKLRDDDLPGKPGDPDHSYLGLMRADFITMVQSLGGDPTALRAANVADTVPDHAVYPQ